MNRRNLLKMGMASAGTLLALNPKALAQVSEACGIGLTPKQTKGPFYPVFDQVDKDADLIFVKGKSEPARGEIVIVEGAVTDDACVPVAGVLVEIWQACATGRYNHPSDPNTAELDPNFQYWGKSVTDANGKYRFRTLIPGSYQADKNWRRPPHIHFKVSRLGYRELITQMYFKGDELNDVDLILQDLDHEDQNKVIVEFLQTEQPHPVGTFDIQIQKIKRQSI
jgi:protocatechuate 3,4-dioxygenase, beta subunit